MAIVSAKIVDPFTKKERVFTNKDVREFIVELRTKGEYRSSFGSQKAALLLEALLVEDRDIW